jgi:hypothetical protein
MTFLPLHPHLPVLFWAALITALASGAYTAYALFGKHQWKGNFQRQVAPLWGFILCLMAVGATIFLFFEHGRIGPVRIDAQGIETPFGKAGYGDIDRYYVHQEVKRSIIDPSLSRDKTHWLVVEERGGKRHLFSEDQYDLRAMLDALEGFTEENRRGKGGNKKGD